LARFRPDLMGDPESTRMEVTAQLSRRRGSASEMARWPKAVLVVIGLVSERETTGPVKTLMRVSGRKLQLGVHHDQGNEGRSLWCRNLRFS
jgi:hypothetical protein